MLKDVRQFLLEIHAAAAFMVIFCVLGIVGAVAELILVPGSGSGSDIGPMVAGFALMLAVTVNVSVPTVVEPVKR
jgi:hypothetical protein